MTPTEAAKILELPAEATSEQVEARFLDLRRKLEDKIAKAPTPGLQAKYRESLTEITAAFETLTLAADSSALPVLKKEAGDRRPEAGGAGRETGDRRPEAGAAATSPRKKSGGMEFVLVAIIAVAVLVAGGWWVMKTKQENEEKARIAAEAKAEQERLATEAQAEKERLAEEARRVAEAKRQADEEEKARQERLLAQLMGDLAEQRIAWEAAEKELQTADRRLSELKSDLRSLRDAPAGRLAEARVLVDVQQDYVDWLNETLSIHPAKVARARAEQLLNANQPDAAAPVLEELKSALAMLARQIPAERDARLSTEGTVMIETHPAAGWTLIDAFGRSHQGRGKGTLEGVAIGSAEVSFNLPGHPPRRESAVVKRTESGTVRGDFVVHELRLDSDPAGASVFSTAGQALGTTPLQLRDLPPGNLFLTLRKQGHYDESVVLELAGSEPLSKTVSLRVRPTKPVVPSRLMPPPRLTVEVRQKMTGSSLRNTGVFRKRGTSDSINLRIVEEWDFSDPAEDGEWQRVRRRFTARPETMAKYLPPGTVIEYRRKPDRSWEPEFQGSGVTGVGLSDTYLTQFDPEIAWLAQCLPPADISAGGTWPVPLTALKPTQVPGEVIEREATGRLVAFNREESRDWIELEFNYKVVVKEDPKTIRESSGLHRLRIDLAGFLMSSESNIQFLNSFPAFNGMLTHDTETTTSTTYTVR